MFTIRKMMLAAALISAALVSQAQTSRIRGTIASAQSNTLAVKLSDGAQSKVVLAPNANVIAVVKASMSDVKEGTFIGSAAMPQPDGTQRALEVHIFPEEMRGTGEGHRPYAPVPQSTMTNGATAGSPVKGVEGSTITIKYKEGEKKIVVPPNTPVVRYVIGSPADLKPGAHFTVLAATKKPDGTYEASRINVGRDGVVPQ
ncbi:MAG TPA: hypothetical protein VNS31_04765 [Ramlibacter sp.]|nr:hypothetical protein [Ramlibacter sp.]